MFFGIGLVELNKIVLVKMIKYMEYIFFSYVLVYFWLRRFDIKLKDVWDFFVLCRLIVVIYFFWKLEGLSVKCVCFIYKEVS